MGNPGLNIGELYRVASSAARKHASKRGLPYHMREDLTQEGVLWLLEHPQRASRARMPDGRLYTPPLSAEIRKHYVNAKADRPPGEVVHRKRVDLKYDKGLVAKIFPAIYDPDCTPFGERAMTGKGRKKWDTMVSTVDEAVTAYGRHSANIRFLYLNAALGERQADIAAEAGVDQKTISNRLTEALGWLTDYCNGLDPDRDKKGEAPQLWDEWDRKRGDGYDVYYEAAPDPEPRPWVP